MDAEWEGEAEALLREAGEASRGALRPPTSPAEAVLAPWLAVGHARLEAMLTGRAVQVLDTARQDFVALLAQRLTGACMGVLAFEQQVQEAASRLTGATPRLEESVAAWRRRFGQYPALKQIVTRVLLDWQRHVGELLTRLETDGTLLGDAFFAGRPLPALTGVDADTGDVHDGGRSVAVLRFEHGHRLVYKPKDLRITRTTLELFAFLNAAGLPLSLHVRQVLVRDGYTWEEFVTAAPCRTADEAARFFQRMGMQLRLFQLLEARDLFLDNLVAAGEHPVFIDLEAMLQPLRPAASPTRAPKAEALLRDSVVHLGILALNALIAPGLPAEDFGALTPPRPLTCPLPGIPAHAALEGRPHSVREGFQVWIPSQLHSPHLGTEPVLASEHLDDLLVGYRVMQDVLRATRERLLAPDGPLRRLAGLPVRYIHQDTWSYMHTLQASLEPAQLVPPERRRAVLASVLEPDAPSPAVARAELEALTRLDIPYFLCLSDGNALLGSDGRVLCEGFFTGTALQRMEQRVRDVDDFPMALHEALVRSTLASGHHAAPRRNVAAVEEDAPHTVDWLAVATRLGDFLLDVAIQEEHGPVWLGLGLDPFHGCEQVDVLGPDVLSGSTGLALVLADLYRETGQERFRAAALGALSDTLEALRGTLTATGTAFVEAGAFRGAGAWLHALSRAALALDTPALAQAARAHAAALPLEQLRERATADVGLGLTGLLMGLVACDARPQARALVELMERAGTSALTTPPPFPAGSRALRWLPSMDAGLTWCTARLASCLGLSPRWELPPLAEPSSPADLLVQLDLTGAAAPTREVLRARALHLLEAHAAGRSTSTEELLDLLDVALVAAEVLGDAPFHEHSRRLGRTLRSRFLRHGRWFPDSLAADRHQLSALWGLPAIAQAFLRLHAPGRTASIRLLRGGTLPRPQAR